MKFFSGFGFKNEKELFDDFIIESDFTVAGFSKGAIEAFEYAYSSKDRVDRLILLSPAFFQNEKESFKKLQLRAFESDKQRYFNNFYNLCSDNTDISQYKTEGNIEELKKLLYYKWSEEKISELKNRGVIIEVFIGSDDRIVDSSKSLDFFQNFISCWYLKGANHILKRNSN